MRFKRGHYPAAGRGRDSRGAQRTQLQLTVHESAGDAHRYLQLPRAVGDRNRVRRRGAGSRAREGGPRQPRLREALTLSGASFCFGELRRVLVTPLPFSVQ